jgi:hypothetical protein
LIDDWSKVTDSPAKMIQYIDESTNSERGMFNKINKLHYPAILLKVLFPLQAERSHPAQLQKCIARVASQRYLRYSLRNNEQI